MKLITKLLGLIGYPLEHSFSERYFNERFSILGYDFIEYRNFPLEDIDEVVYLLKLVPEICGLNVTSPHKMGIMKFLSAVEPEAEKVGSVNTVIVERSVNRIYLTGYNTDIVGFEKSIVPLLEPHHIKALILGTGGAARAVAYVFEKLGIEYCFVSRRFKQEGRSLLYSDLKKEIFEHYHIIINSTSLGMYPYDSFYPPIPYEYLSSNHLLFDLVYNPQETNFLRFGKSKGAKVKNGIDMLYIQANAAWEIFKQFGCFDQG